jgi:hypothetical protein
MPTRSRHRSRRFCIVLQYGGTLTVVTKGHGVLTNGETFKLFVAGSTTATFGITNLPN